LSVFNKENDDHYFNHATSTHRIRLLLIIKISKQCKTDVIATGIACSQHLSRDSSVRLNSTHLVESSWSVGSSALIT